MELLYGIHNLHPQRQRCVATIGAFDGIHLGHQAVIEKLKVHAKRLKLPSTVIVFEPLPREYFAPLKSPARISNFRERYLALKACGVDRVLLIHFTEKVSKMSADDFIQKVFIDALRVKHIVVGDDLRFGHDRQGDFKLLQDFGKRYDFAVEKTQTFKINGERVSSTRIRKLLQQGELELAQQLLGRPYSMTGKVVHGQHLGRLLGSPTANVRLQRFSSALSGVYVVNIRLANGEYHKGVANVGTRPTINDSIQAILEVHILNFARDIYGQRIDVFFLHKLRDEQRFSSIDKLKAQIYLDIKQARYYFQQHNVSLINHE